MGCKIVMSWCKLDLNYDLTIVTLTLKCQGCPSETVRYRRLILVLMCSPKIELLTDILDIYCSMMIHIY